MQTKQQKKPSSFKRTRTYPALPPFFINSSRCLPLQVRRHLPAFAVPGRYSSTITCAGSVAAYSTRIPAVIHFCFGAQLKDVFMQSFPCASHQPAAFCMLPFALLILVIAFHQKFEIRFIIKTPSANVKRRLQKFTYCHKLPLNHTKSFHILWNCGAVARFWFLPYSLLLYIKIERIDWSIRSNAVLFIQLWLW